MWLFGAVGTRNPVGPVATVFPEFIARDGQERADGGRQGDKRRVGAARRRSRGLGPARLDGARARATVADKVMRSGKTAGQGNGPPHADRTASEARRPEAGSRAGGVSRAERGNDGSPSGARPRRGLDAQHDSATGHLPEGRGRPAFNARSGRVHARHRGSAANAVWPIRRSRVGSAQGRQACAVGIARRAFPWRASRRRAGIAPRGRDAKGRPATPQGRVRQ